MIGLAIVLAVALVGFTLLRTRYRHTRREPARSCLAPNRSRGRNQFCQKSTPRGGYCSVHYNQHSWDNSAVGFAIFLGVAFIVVASIMQSQR